MSSSSATHKERLLERSNAEVDVPFAPREYARRVEAVRAAMRQAGVDLLYVSDPDDLNYLTGFKALWYQANGHSGWGPSSGLAIAADGSKPVYFETEKERLLVGHTTTGAEFSLLPRYSKPLMEFVLDRLEAEGWLGGTVALELSSYRPFPSISARFQDRLEECGCTIVDGTPLVRGVRHQKSVAEIATTVQAATIADEAIRAGIEAIRPGVSELEVYGAMFSAMMRAGGDMPAMPPQVLSGPRSLHARGLPSRRSIVLGDLVTLSAFGCYDRYHALVTRTVSVGAPREETATFTAAVAGSADALLAGLAASDSAVALESAAATTFASAGAWERRWQCFGHEVGVALPPDAMSAGLFSLDETPVADEPFGADTTLALSLGFLVAGTTGLFRAADTVVFREGRADVLSALARDLIVLE